jgi:hypothetical protein
MRMILPAMHTDWEWLTKTIYDPAIFWAMVTAIATVALVFATIGLVWIGLIPLVRSKKADLAERFKEELLTPSAQGIFFLAAHGFLRFVIDRQGEREIGYFSIIKLNENIMQQRLDQMFGDQRIVMTFEMDDKILAPLEEIAYYEKHGEIEFEDAYRIFGDYIDMCWSNAEIVLYIKWLRSTLKADAYKNMEALQKKLREHYEKLRAEGMAAV